MEERYIKRLSRQDQPDGVIRFDVPETFPKKPSTRYELAVERRGPGWDFEIAGRLIADEIPRLWFETDDWWGRAELALARDDSSPRVVPQVRSADVESISDWSEFFADALVQSDATPLYPGRWQLVRSDRGPWSGVRDRWLIPRLREHRDAGWDSTYEDLSFHFAPMPIRPASDVDSGRVKWYRKLTRQKKLPPVLVYYCATLLNWLILDGHDRMLAASLENKTPEVLALAPIRSYELGIDVQGRAAAVESLRRELDRKPDDEDTIDGVNRALLQLYEEEWHQYSGRAWAVPGGWPGWLEEVRALEGVGSEQAREVLRSMQRI